MRLGSQDLNLNLDIQSVPCCRLHHSPVHASDVNKPNPRATVRRAAARSPCGTVSAMDDDRIHGRIEQLVAEEHDLWNRESSGQASDDDRQRLESVRVSLDQCWDLLRQRRAFREEGGNPDDATARSEGVVENYQQ